MSALELKSPVAGLRITTIMERYTFSTVTRRRFRRFSEQDNLYQKCSANTMQALLEHKVTGGDVIKNNVSAVLLTVCTPRFSVPL